MRQFWCNFSPRTPGCLVTLCLVALLTGCAGRYFSPAEAPPAPLTHALDDWPYQEYWAGVVFNGAKIGFSHTRLSPSPDASGYIRIESEASLILRFLGFEKIVQMHSTDVVDSQLNLIRFDGEYHIDGSDLAIVGSVGGNQIEIDLVNAGHRSRRTIAAEGPVIPASAILMYPLIHGLAVGREHRYLVFNGETLSVSEVEQRVEAYEKSKLFPGEAFKVTTRLEGQGTTSWLDQRGLPVLEIGLNGVMISALEEESEAKRYLAAAALNKQEVMLDFSTVPVDQAIKDPRRVTWLDITVHGAPAPPAQSAGQQCAAVAAGWRCQLRAGVGNAAGGDEPRYMVSSLTVPYGDSRIRSLAEKISANAQNPDEKIARILDWLRQNIESHPADTFSALDVLEKRRAECQGHAYLFAALARADGIPTRIVNGLVYSEGQSAFLFHTWAESYFEGRWRAVDPTFFQPVADATHFRILEGEEPNDLVPLTDWIGRLKIEVEGYRHDAAQ